MFFHDIVLGSASIILAAICLGAVAKGLGQLHRNI